MDQPGAEEETYNDYLAGVFDQEAAKLCRNDLFVISDAKFRFPVGDQLTIESMSRHELETLRNDTLPIVYGRIEKQFALLTLEETLHEKFLGAMFEMVLEVFDYVMLRKKERYHKSVYQAPSAAGCDYDTIFLVGFQGHYPTLYIFAQVRKSKSQTADYNSDCSSESDMIDGGFTTRGGPDDKDLKAESLFPKFETEEKTVSTDTDSDHGEDRDCTPRRPLMTSPDWTTSKTCNKLTHDVLAKWDHESHEAYSNRHTFASHNTLRPRNLSNQFEQLAPSFSSSIDTSVLVQELSKQGEYDYSTPLPFNNTSSDNSSEQATPEKEAAVNRVTSSIPTPPDFGRVRRARRARGRRGRGRGRGRGAFTPDRPRRRHRPPILTPPSDVSPVGERRFREIAPKAFSPRPRNNRRYSPGDESHLFIHPEDRDDFQNALWRPPRHLFIGGLYRDETEDDLVRILSKFGRVEAVRKRPTADFGFIDFAANASGIKCLNNKESLPFRIQRCESKNSSRRNTRKGARRSRRNRKQNTRTRTSSTQSYTARLSDWLHGNELSACKSTLIAHGYDSKTAILEGIRDEEDVRRLGLPQGQQRLLWSVIEKTRSRESYRDLRIEGELESTTRQSSQSPRGEEMFFDFRRFLLFWGAAYKPVEVTVRHRDQQMTCQVFPCDTVGKLKHTLASDYSMPGCKLFFGGKELQDTDQFQFLNISKDSIILCSPPYKPRVHATRMNVQPGHRIRRGYQNRRSWGTWDRSW